MFFFLLRSLWKFVGVTGWKLSIWYIALNLLGYCWRFLGFRSLRWSWWNYRNELEASSADRDGSWTGPPPPPCPPPRAGSSMLRAKQTPFRKNTSLSLKNNLYLVKFKRKEKKQNIKISCKIILSWKKIIPPPLKKIIEFLFIMSWCTKYMEKRTRSGYDANKNHQQIIKYLHHIFSKVKKFHTEIFLFSYLCSVLSNYQTV